MKQIFVYIAYNASEMELNIFCFFKKMIPPLFLLDKLALRDKWLAPSSTLKTYELSTWDLQVI